jgi:hypothetical protein
MAGFAGSYRAVAGTEVPTVRLSAENRVSGADAGVANVPDMLSTTIIMFPSAAEYVSLTSSGVSVDSGALLALAKTIEVVR